jgi:hypothetical protein
MLVVTINKSGNIIQNPLRKLQQDLELDGDEIIKEKDFNN